MAALNGRGWGRGRQWRWWWWWRWRRWFCCCQRKWVISWASQSMVSRPSPYLFCIKNEFLPKLCEHFFFVERKKQALDSIAHSGKKTEDNLLGRGFELNKLRYYKTTALNCTNSFFLLCLLWSIWLNLLATVSLSIVLKKNSIHNHNGKENE